MDLNDKIYLLKQSLQTANSAVEAARIGEEIEKAQRVADAQARANAKKDAILVQGAQANIAQMAMLEEQLKAVKGQNEQLKEQYNLLKEMYESTKKQAEDNAKAAKASKRFGIISLVVSSLIGVVSIVVGVILAIFL